MVLSFSIASICYDYESNPERFYSIPLTTDVSESHEWGSPDEKNYDKELLTGYWFIFPINLDTLLVEQTPLPLSKIFKHGYKLSDHIW